MSWRKRERAKWTKRGDAEEPLTLLSSSLGEVSAEAGCQHLSTEGPAHQGCLDLDAGMWKQNAANP